MACLRKKGNKFYIKDYVNGKEKWFATRTDDKTVADYLLGKYETAKKEGLGFFPTETRLKMMLIGFCLYLMGVLTPANYLKETSRLRMIFGPACAALGGSGANDSQEDEVCLGDAPKNRLKNLEDLTTRNVTDFLDKIAVERELSGKTVNNYREILHRFVNWAITQKGVRFPGGVNPVDSVSKRNTGPLPISYLNQGEIVQQLKALADNLKLQAMVAVLIFAGLRRDELLWLRTSDIIERGGTLRILVRAKVYDGVKWRPKNKKDRYVPVSPALNPFLQRALGDKSEDRWLFPSPTGVRWDGDNFSALLREANKDTAHRQAENGEDPMPTWACLDYRHTFGTMLASKGTSLYVIAEWMGNSPEICRKHYAKLIPCAVDRFVDFTGCSGNDTQDSWLAEVLGVMVPDVSAPYTASVSEADDTTTSRNLRLVVNNR